MSSDVRVASYLPLHGVTTKKIKLSCFPPISDKIRFKLYPQVLTENEKGDKNKFNHKEGQERRKNKVPVLGGFVVKLMALEIERVVCNIKSGEF